MAGGQAAGGDVMPSTRPHPPFITRPLPPAFPQEHLAVAQAAKMERSWNPTSKRAEKEAREVGAREMGRTLHSLE